METSASTKTTYKDIEITVGDKIAVEQAEQLVRLTKEAIDKEWIPAHITSLHVRGIEIVSPTEGAAAEPFLLLDTTTGRTGRVLLSSVTDGKATETTEAKSFSWIEKFWQVEPTCGVVATDHQAATLAKSDASSTSKSHALQAVFIRSDSLWANDNPTVLTFSFIDGAPTSDSKKNQQDKVKRVITEWEKYGNIQFKYVSEVRDATIRVAFDSSSGSWSYVGKDNLAVITPNPTMNLGWVSGDQQLRDEERGVILHEFGHALGLLHEHQSPLRGDKITLKRDAVLAFYKETQGWTDEEVERQIFNVYNSTEISNFSEFDSTSVMEYFMPAAMNEQNKSIPPNNTLSAFDKAYMTINYPGRSREQFANALDVSGVSGNVKATILELYDQKDWNEVRFEFTKFCTETRIARRASDKSMTVEPKRSPNAFYFPDECPVGEQPTEFGPSGVQKGGSSVGTDLWLPGDKITFSFVQGTSEATPYRRKAVTEVFNNYSDRVNLRFREIPFNPTDEVQNQADVHIYFGHIPNRDITAFSYVGKSSVGLKRDQRHLNSWGGTVESSLILTDVVPKTEPTTQAAKSREQRVLYHEIGHVLGLLHEHAHSETTDDDSKVSDAIAFDKKSIMFYPDKKTQNQFKEFFNPLSAQFNDAASEMDYAFLGVLYPQPKGHVKDRFEKDLQDLGITSHMAILIAQRDLAFSYFDTEDFTIHINKLREMVVESLASESAGGVFKRSMAAEPPTGPSRVGILADSGSAKTETNFLELMTTELKKYFKPTSGQTFALQFPGRFLQQEEYAWDTSSAGIYGQFVKPTVVNESEFRLVDQLYNVGEVVGAPNGTNLSIVYEQLLNNLVPDIVEEQINFSRQQSQIRAWLLKEVPASKWIQDKVNTRHTPTGADAKVNAAEFDGKVNRMELSDALMEEYLAAKQAWELERDNMIRETKPEDLDALTRKLSHITAIRQAQLSAKHADAVVHGYSHVIRQYLGYMDIKTPAEALQDAKDAMRESATSSLDGAMKIYPIHMQPIDWFKGLSTSFTMEDLTADAELIWQQINSKSSQLDSLSARLAFLKNKPTANVEALERQLDDAQKAFDSAQSALTLQYSTNVVSLAKTFLENGAFQKAKFQEAGKKADIAVKVLDKISEGMEQLAQAENRVTNTSRALAQMLAIKARAEAGDTTKEIVDLDIQIVALKREIDELTARLKALPKTASTTSGEVFHKPEKLTHETANVPLFTPSTSSGGSRWQQIQFTHTSKDVFSSTSETSGSYISSTKVSFFFGSYNNQYKSAFAEEFKKQTESTMSFEVGFRATLVTVDRGGWFQPQFFKMSKAFHAINPNIKWTWNQLPVGASTISDVAKDPQQADKINAYLLPAFPAGFLICKDITIKIKHDMFTNDTASSVFESASNSSTGFFIWSSSSASSSKSLSQSHSMQRTTDGVIIRIPGPQILGYFLQYTDFDLTTQLPAELPSGFLLSDEDYEKGGKGKKPEMGARSIGQPEDTSPVAPVPTPKE